MLLKIQKGMDSLMTVIGALLLAVMFVVITLNVILRLIPSVGGFKWYMEFSQYANVWAMMLGGAGIVVMGTNLRVEAVDSILQKFPWGYKLGRIIVDVAEIVFYLTVTYSGWLLATKAKQKVSTMPQFTMGQVYWIFPVAGGLCVIAALIHLAVTLSAEQEEKKEA
ncbi:MAG: TRAP transporter small permease subunit [Clostridiaceae bacterium]|nr:TRAP transporter small permease subunit [Clostridiaceae bacterium]